MKRKLHNLLLFVFMLSATTAAIAQKGKKANNAAATPKTDNAAAAENYQIKVKIEGLKDTVVFLAYHYDTRQYLLDTCQINSKGEGTFIGKEKLKGGIYLIVLPRKNYFEFIADGKQQKYVIKTTLDKAQENLTVENSRENEAFIAHHKKMREQGEKYESIKKEFDAVKDDKEKSEPLRKQLIAIEEENKKYRAELIKQYDGTFFANVMRLMMEPEIPEAPKDANGKVIDSLFQYKYFRAHYFDQVDFSDERLLRTPIFKQKFLFYIEKLVPQHHDSLSRAAIYIVDKAKANKEVFRYVLTSLARKYETSNIMGQDGVFVRLAQKYYLTREAFWVDTAQYNKIYDRVVKMSYTVLGNVAPELSLKDTANKDFSIHKSINPKAKYTLLYFWTPSCGHCRRETPEIYKLYQKYKDKGFDVIAIFTETDVKSWKKYIQENKLSWKNAYDPDKEDKTRHYSKSMSVVYDIMSTPQLFLIDSNKRIVLKKINHEQLDKFLDDTLIKGKK